VYSKIKIIIIENFRSIVEDPIEIEFPTEYPTVLLGENSLRKIQAHLFFSNAKNPTHKKKSSKSQPSDPKVFKE
jgi:hypothetical protein